jgi:hypothetical protein
MDYQPPGEDYIDYISEPCDWLLSLVRPDFSDFAHTTSLDYSAAIHEASHAVLCEHFGYRVTTATIQGTMGRFAQIEPTEQNPEHMIVIAHAGYVGQIQVVCKRHAFDMANQDSLMIHSIREREKYTVKHLRELYQQSLGLVEQNWAQIQQVADMLATEKVLTGEEVRAIIQKAR